jgi:hypothetical protein
MGLSPNIWGRQAWQFIHCVALSYPKNPTEAQRDMYLTFYHSLSNILPCEICAAHYKSKIEKNPPNMTNRAELFRWTVDIHNEVNIDNGKRTLSYSEALLAIEENAKDNTAAMMKAIVFSVVSITGLMLLSFALSKKE